MNELAMRRSWIVVNVGSGLFFHWRRWSCLAQFLLLCSFQCLAFFFLLSGRVCGTLRASRLDPTVSLSKNGCLLNSQVAFSNLQWTNPGRLEAIKEIHISLLSSQHLQHHESGVEGESCYYHCVLCNYSTKAKLNLIQHVRSMKHQRSESLRKLQRLQKGLPEEEEDLGQIFTIRKCPAAEAGECCLPCMHGAGRWAPRVSARPSRQFRAELGGFLVSLPCCGDDADRQYGREVLAALRWDKTPVVPAAPSAALPRGAWGWWLWGTKCLRTCFVSCLPVAPSVPARLNARLTCSSVYVRSG